jgi:hypothetical protein
MNYGEEEEYEEYGGVGDLWRVDGLGGIGGRGGGHSISGRKIMLCMRCCSPMFDI